MRSWGWFFVFERTEVQNSAISTSLILYTTRYILIESFILIFYYRFGEVQEVVDAVTYLLSDRSSMITGTCLPIDGGYLAT